MRVRILLLIFLFSSCRSQVAMISSQSAVNLLKPGTYSQILTNTRYNKLVEETKKENSLESENRSNQSLEVSCQQESKSEDLAQILSLNDKIRDIACSCRPWGSCQKDVCSCENLCPFGMNIFKGREMNPEKIKENSLAFDNNEAGQGTFGYTDTPDLAPAKFYELSMESQLERIKVFKEKMLLVPNKSKIVSIFGYKGYCWGHADLTQKFNRLAFFKGRNGDKKFNSDKERMNYYRSVIDQIANNQAVDIEGFDNLYEFSADPEIEEYLIKKVGDLWKRNAASFQSLNSLYSKTPTDHKKFSDEIKTRLSNGQEPEVIFNIEGSTSHVVLLNNYLESREGSRVYCVRDNNYLPTNGECVAGIVVTPDGKMFYSRPNGVSVIKNIAITHNENKNVLEQQKSLSEKCAKDKECSQKK